MTLCKLHAPKQARALLSAASSTLLIAAGLFAADAIINPGNAQNSIAVNSCNAGYAETWIVGQSCFVGRSVEVKTDDAIHISCADNNEYSIALFVEPAGSDPAGSNAVQHDLCPGNGFITRDADGEQVLRCNFWESTENVAKQFEVKLQPSVSGTSTQSMSWKVSELDNPNVVCGVSGRPDDNSDTAGSGRTS